MVSISVVVASPEQSACRRTKTLYKATTIATYLQTIWLHDDSHIEIACQLCVLIVLFQGGRSE
jgi:hypothetical protein